MSNYIVDGSDLTSVANAIRAKSGGSSQLAFPAGFVSEIGNIPSGGGGTVDDLASGTWPSGEIEITVSTVIEHAFDDKPGITRVYGEDVTLIKGNAFAEMPDLLTAFFPNATCETSYNFQSEPKMTALVIGSFGTATYVCYRSKLLKVVDVLGSTGRIGQMQFANNAAPVIAFDTLILRSTSIIPLQNTNAFNYTKFASGQSGGTIYIPKTLFDHLGDGTADDYKAASNWSTVNGYGTITWAKIEGSYYENHYADGTAIS